MHNSRLFMLMILASFHISIAGAQPSSYQKTADGVIIHTADGRQTVRLQVITDKIIRVQAAPTSTLPQRQSLITNYSKTQTSGITLVPQQSKLILKTRSIQAVADLRSGQVTFLDSLGKSILAEKQIDGRTFLPAVFDGQPNYQLTQAFETAPGDAIYGLGQHQDDVFNHKGHQVLFFQNNTEVAIPFFVSTGKYAVLWDNYSLTTAGDIRPFKPLTQLQLFSKDGEEGWLTASYLNDKNKPATVDLQRAESNISMEYLGESLQRLPAAFMPASGLVKWEGSIASGFTGMHQLRFIFGGSLKVWVNDSLVIDRWRKAWNPAPALVTVSLQKGSKTPLRIEWTPEGTESYLSLKWQEPVPASQKDVFAFSSEAGHLVDYYFVYGKTIDEQIAGYRYLTGKAPIVPNWAMGFWQSRERYKNSDELLGALSEYRKRNIPIDNIVLDWSYWKENDWGSQEFDPTRFASPEKMVQQVHDQNAHIMISVWPKFYEGIAAYKDFEKKGWLYKRNIADRQRDWIGKGYTSTFYDAFNADARKGFWELISEKILSKGFDAWWMDASEPDILSNVSPLKRKEQMTPTALGSAAEYLNAYPLQNAKGIYEGQRSEKPNQRVFLLTRSGFAGSQRYAAAIWSGDIGATWHDMKAQIPAGTNFSMSGLPYWTMDIGGFVVESRFEKPNKTDLEEWRELQTRWYQFGAFVPIFRSHGQYPYREVYNIAPEGHPAYESMVYYDKLRYRLMPYVYSLAGHAYHNNGTIMRALPMDFAGDATVHNIGDQFMFGPSLLVSPVYQYKDRQRKLYLPKGQGWYDAYTGKYEAGGRWINANASFERMPLYIKEGSIVPMGPALQYTGEKPADTITLFVYTGKDAAFSLYEDGGTTYDYEKGQYATIPLIYNEQTKILTVGERKGSFPGMLNQRVFRIVMQSPQSARGLQPEAKPQKDVMYNGKSVQVAL